ncbi:MAG: hypothetical protein GX786_02560 [Clostridiales bacterium]|nr:hypothetical protein [Clostridiales bacterium]
MELLVVVGAPVFLPWWFFRSRAEGKSVELAQGAMGIAYLITGAITFFFVMPGGLVILIPYAIWATAFFVMASRQGKKQEERQAELAQSRRREEEKIAMREARAQEIAAKKEAAEKQALLETEKEGEKDKEVGKKDVHKEE